MLATLLVQIQNTTDGIAYREAEDTTGTIYRTPQLSLEKEVSTQVHRTGKEIQPIGKPILS